MSDPVVEEFELFCKCSCLKTLLQHHRKLCDLIGISPSKINEFYPTFKSKFVAWKWKSFWEAFDKKASNACYNGGQACANTKVLVVGAGPVGLRAAIEAQFLGAKVVVMEMRELISRHNVLHLWQFVIEDLKALNAKKFYTKFCAGGIEHISIRRLQFMLLKVALILGVEVHIGVGYDGLNAPADDGSVGWRAKTKPPDHALSNYEFDVVIGANGKHHTLQGFTRKSFRGKLAIAITANFINGHTPAENQCPEIAGVASVYKQEFFNNLREATGAKLENIVYYKDETHYFVMTVLKECLLEKKVILNDNPDTVQLLSTENRDLNALQQFATDVCRHCTENKLPDMQFALTHQGEKDVAMFDFTHMFSADHSCRVDERHGRRLLQMLIGDSLLEPFWPTGSGCARGFLSAMDAAWAIKSWKNGQSDPLAVIAERESTFRALPRAESTNLNKNYAAYTIDPTTRYPFVDLKSVPANNVQFLYVVEGPIGMPVARERQREGEAPASEPPEPQDWVLQDQMLMDENDDGMATGDVEMSEDVWVVVDEDDYKNFDITFESDLNRTFDSRLEDDADYMMPPLEGEPETIGGVLRDLGVSPNTKLTKGKFQFF